MSGNSTESVSVRPGERLDHFQLIRPLGRGGMGEVHLARDVNLGRKVAIKVLRPDALGSREAVERFLFEARTTARFNHPHIIAIYHVGEVRGSPYVALEYLEGETLRQRMARARMSHTEAVRTALAIAEALAEAHAHSVLHRDLKPENVMIPRDGRLRVLDFGLAKVTGGADAEEPGREGLPGEGDAALATFETQEGAISGTPRYMAPEQWSGQPASTAADVWALGLILYELIAGEHPLSGEGPFQIVFEVTRPEPLPQCSREAGEEVAQLVDRCLDKDAEGRPSIGEVVQGLSEALPDSDRAIVGGESPFVGLIPLGERHRGRFFGRDAELGAFLERLRDEPVLPVVGPSGAGKSSFVEAGILPRLREQRPWTVLDLRPGRDPMRALAARLLWGESLTGPGATFDTDAGCATDAPTERSPSTGSVVELDAFGRELAAELAASPARLALRLERIAEREGQPVVLVVDQLEELCTRSDDPVVRRVFMEALCLAADDPLGPVRVIFTLRDDYLGRLAEGEVAREVLGRVTVLRSPGPAALSEMLTRPVEASGYCFDDPGLVAEIVDSIRDEAAALPLLQVAGQGLWDRRDRVDHRLTRVAYEELGGVGGLLARHADGVLEGLSSSRVKTARLILLRLVTAEGTRQGLQRDELLSRTGDEGEHVLDLLIAQRLLTSRKSRGDDEAEVEIELVHESLIEHWDQLADWILEGRGEAGFLREARQAAELWERRGRRPDELWSDEALRDGLRSLERLGPDAPHSVVDFLHQGRDRERRRRTRRWLLLACAFAVLAFFAVSMTFMARLASQQRGRAEEARQQEALRRAEAELDGALVAYNRLAPVDSRAKLRSSMETRDDPAARDLWVKLQRHPLWRAQDLGSGPLAVDWTPDGRQLVVAVTDGTLHLLDPHSHGARVLRGHTGMVYAVDVGPRGQWLVSGTSTGEVGLWNLAAGSYRLLDRRELTVLGVKFTPDGEEVVVVDFGGWVRSLDVHTGDVVWEVDVGSPVLALDMAPDGTRCAIGTESGVVILLEARTGERLARCEHDASLFEVAYDPTGRWLAAGDNGGVVRLWDASACGEGQVVARHGGRVSSLAFSPDGTTLAVAGAGDEIRSWDVATGAAVWESPANPGGVRGLSWEPGGRLLAAAGLDHAVRVWHTDNEIRKMPQRGHASYALRVRFGPDGELLTTRSADGSARVWSGSDGEERLVLRPPPGSGWGLAHHPDGEIVATGGREGWLRTYSLASGEEVASVQQDSWVVELDFSPDGRRLVTGTVGERVHVMDARTLDDLLSLHVPGAELRGVCHDPAGPRLATYHGDGEIKLFDVHTGSSEGTFAVSDTLLLGVEFHPTNRSLLFLDLGGQPGLLEPSSGATRLLDVPCERAHEARFHPDGERIGLACQDGTGWIIDLVQGTSTVLRGHRGEVNSIDFSADGAVAATCADDGTVRAWDVETGLPRWWAPLMPGGPHELLQLSGHGNEGAAEAWRVAVETPARRASWSADRRQLCVHSFDGVVELWDLASDTLRLETAALRPSRVEAAFGGCGVLTGTGDVVALDPAGEATVIRERAAAMSAYGDGVVVAGDDEIVVLDGSGAATMTMSGVPRTSAVAMTSGVAAVGTVDGDVLVLETRERDGEGPDWSETLHAEHAPASTVVSLLATDGGVLLGGFADGSARMWSLQGGRRLASMKLHGPVVHLAVEGGRAQFGTELGDHESLDIAVLQREYCDVLRELWAEVPVIWEGGRTVVRPPDPGHRCALE